MTMNDGSARDVAPVVGRARTVAGLRMLPTIARAVYIEPQSRPPSRRIGRDLAPAKRVVSLGPLEAVDVKAIGTPHAERKRLHEMCDGIANANMRNQCEGVASAAGASDPAWRNRHD